MQSGYQSPVKPAVVKCLSNKKKKQETPQDVHSKTTLC